MLETLLQLATKGIPESFLSVLLIYMISQTKFDRIKYIIISVIYIISTYFIRMLPIVAGINTIIGFSLLIYLMIVISNAQPKKTILAAIVSILVIIICELLNLLLLLLIYGEETANALVGGNSSFKPLFKAIATAPSTIFLGIFAIAIFFIMKHLANRKIKNK